MQPGQQSEQVIRAKGRHRVAIRRGSAGKLVARAELQKGANDKAGRMLVWLERFAAQAHKVFPDSVKIHHLRKAAWAMKFNGRRALIKLQVLFVRDCFVSGQQQHSSVSTLTKFLERFESRTWKQHGA